MFSAIPYIGDDLVIWIWGGFVVDNATLTRFFSLHFLLPFIIAGIRIVHLLFLHQTGRNNPLGINRNFDKILFHPYFSSKDLFGFVIMLTLLITICFFFPWILGDPENFIPANPLVTPVHIQPEWYFLIAYAILRSIPNKLLGVLALLASILILLILPVVNSSAIRSTLYRPIHQTFFWFLVFDFILLGYIGQQTPETPFIEIGQIASVYYFAYFLVIIPTLGYLEKSLLKV